MANSPGVVSLHFWLVFRRNLRRLFKIQRDEIQLLRQMELVNNTQPCQLFLSEGQRGLDGRGDISVWS